MLVARYFLYVGGALLAVLLAITALVPQDTSEANRGATGVDKSTVRIRSAQKLPERVVFDTNLPTIVPPESATRLAAAPLPPQPAAEPSTDQSPVSQGSAVAQGAAAQTSRQGRSRDSYAQASAAEARKHEQARKRRIARARIQQPPPMMAYGQPPMRVAQQQRYGFFGGGPFWGTW